MKIDEKHRFGSSNEDNSVSFVTSDWPASRFGNDGGFMTRLRPEVQTGHRTGPSLPEKSSKCVPPTGVHKRCS